MVLSVLIDMGMPRHDTHERGHHLGTSIIGCFSCGLFGTAVCPAGGFLIGNLARRRGAECLRRNNGLRGSGFGNGLVLGSGDDDHRRAHQPFGEHLPLTWPITKAW